MRDYNASTLSYVNAAVSQNIFSLFLQTRFLPAAAFIQADITNLLHTEHCEHNSFEVTILVTPKNKKCFVHRFCTVQSIRFFFSRFVFQRNKHFLCMKHVHFDKTMNT